MSRYAYVSSFVLCFAALVGTAPRAFALDLLQAYEAAKLNDASFNAAKAAARAGQESVPLARAQLLPNISATFNRTNNDLTSLVPNLLGQVTESQNSYPSRSDNLTVRQPIYRKQQIVQYQQALSQVRDVNAVFELETQNLALRVGSTYFDALLAGDQLALVQTQLDAYGTYLDAARKAFAAGSGTRTEVDEAQARLDMSVAQELEARQAVDYTRQQLEVVVGKQVTALATLAPELDLTPPLPADVGWWIGRAEQSNPEIRVLQARLDVARLEIDRANSGHHPTLDAIAQWNRTSSESIQALNTRYESRAIGVQLVIPLYAGGGVNAAVRQAIAARDRAEHVLEGGRRDLGVRVHREFRNVSEGVLRVRALEQADRSAAQALISSQRSFQAGSRTRLDVLNAQNGQMSVLRDLAQARYAYLLARLRLSALVEEASAATIEAMNSSFKP